MPPLYSVATPPYVAVCLVLAALAVREAVAALLGGQDGAVKAGERAHAEVGG